MSQAPGQGPQPFEGDPKDLRAHLESMVRGDFEHVSDEEWEVIEAALEQERQEVLDLTTEQIAILHGMVERDEVENGTAEEVVAAFRDRVRMVLQGRPSMTDALALTGKEVEFGEASGDIRPALYQRFDTAAHEMEQLRTEADKLAEEYHGLISQYNAATDQAEKARINRLIEALDERRDEVVRLQNTNIQAFVAGFSMMKKHYEGLEDRGQLDSLSDAQKAEYEKIKEYTQQFEDALALQELRTNSQRTAEEERRYQELLRDRPEWVRIFERQAQEQELAKPTPEQGYRDSTQLVREQPGGRYRVLETQQYMEQLEGEEVYTHAEALVGEFEKFLVKDGNPEDNETFITLRNIIWRNAFNNRGLHANEPFLAHDLGTQQAFIYLPNGQPSKVIVSRAYHGYGGIGDNTPEKGGTSLGSKDLEEGRSMGGKFAHRVIVNGLEEGINRNDRTRLIRIHEKDRGRTAGCTGLPTPVARLFADAVEQTGGGSQETFISDGGVLPENWSGQMRTGVNTQGRAMDGQFPFEGGELTDAAKQAADNFINKLNVFERLVLAFMSPIGLAMAISRNDKVMEYFWRKLGGEEDPAMSQSGHNADYGRGNNRRNSGESASEYVPGGKLYTAGEALLGLNANEENKGEEDGKLVVTDVEGTSGDSQEYEIGGINSRQHPDAFKRIQEMIEAGKPDAEVRREVINYTLHYSGKTKKVQSTNLGVDTIMRDMTLRHGEAGSTKLAETALKKMFPDNPSVTVDGTWSPEEQQLWSEVEGTALSGDERIAQTKKLLEEGIKPALEELGGELEGGDYDANRTTELISLISQDSLIGQYLVAPLGTFPEEEFRVAHTTHDVRIVGDPADVLQSYEMHGGGRLETTRQSLTKVYQELQAATPGSPRQQQLQFAATSLANYLDVHNKAVPYSFPPVGVGSVYARSCSSLSDCIVETSNSVMQNLHRQGEGGFQTRQFDQQFSGARSSYSKLFSALESTGCGYKTSYADAKAKLDSGEVPAGCALVSIRGGGHGGLLLPGGVMVDSSSRYRSNGSAIGERQQNSAHQVFIVTDPQKLYDRFQ